MVTAGFYHQAIAPDDRATAASGGEPEPDRSSQEGSAATSAQADSRQRLPDGEGESTADILATSAAGPSAVRGGAMRVGAYVVGALVSVFSAALLFRHLGVGDTGLYVTALTLVAIVAAFSDLGLTAVGVRELSARAPEERWPLARDLLGLRITLTLAGAVVVTAIAAAAYSGRIALGVALGCVGLLLQATQDNVSLPLVVGLRQGWVAALELTRQLLTTALIVALVLAGASLVPFLAIPIPVGAVVLAIAMWLVRGVRALSPTFSLGRWRRFLRAMLPYAAAVTASALYFRVAILLVSVLSSSRQLGYFSASFRIIEVLTAIPALLVGAAFPIFSHAARGDHARLGYAIGRVFEVALIAGAWAAVSIAVGAPLAIRIIGGPKFAPAVPVLAIQGIALGVTFVSFVWGNAMLSLGQLRSILLISVSVLVLNAALVAALVPLDGARGAASATVVAELVSALAQAYAVVRARPQLRPSLRILPYVMLAAGVGVIPLAMTGLPVVVRLVISTTLFGAVVLGTRSLPPELIDLAPWLGRRLGTRPGGT